MKNIYRYGIFFLSLLMTQFAYGQDDSKRAKLNQQSVKQKIKEDKARSDAFIKAKEVGWDTIGLVRIDEFGNPFYVFPTNNTAATSIGTVSARTTYGLDGQGMTIGIWEAGTTTGNGVPRITHQDLIGRVTIKDNSPSSAHTSHATHVAGTMIGNPPASAGNTSKGMAPSASLDAYGSNNHTSEMISAGAASISEIDAGFLSVSNHSYGGVGGWTTISGTSNYTWSGGASNFVGGGTDPSFGVYDSTAGLWDSLTTEIPYYLICASAGNENNDDPIVGTSMVRNGSGGTFVPYNTSLHPLGDGIYDNGFNTIKSWALAKNILTVGATDNAGGIAPFSSTGPTVDGRIKPDICGVGVGLTSAVNGSNTSYGSSNGTSMSSPNVAGSLLLLQELYKKKFKVGTDHLYMRAASLKALAIHSAMDLGNTGPDYTYGWGRMRTNIAANYINDDAWANSFFAGQSVIIEDSIMTASEVFEYKVNTGGGSGNNVFKVTLVYADTAGNNLVNDLDLRVISNSSNITYSPWLLDPNNPSTPASNGDDDVNNVEQVVVEFVSGIDLSIRVSVEGNLFNNKPQPFSLVISGLNTTCHGSIQHKTLDLPSNTYTAKHLIKSQAKLVTAGREIIYQTNGKVVLKPGFHAKAQSSTGAGFFKTTSGTCN